MRAALRTGAAPASPTLVELFAEVYRLRLLTGLEELLRQQGYCAVAGVDEAGRGALAGPVVAAAVVVDPRRLVPGVDDSKQLSPAERERLARVVQGSALAWSVAAVSPEIIDRVNILEATRQAMRQALLGLRPQPDCAVVDAVGLCGLPFPALPLIRGDSVSYAVASASILAKVERDRLMAELDRDYPHYGFAEHKGYGVPGHLSALSVFGPSPVHRLTYRPVVPRREVAC